MASFPSIHAGQGGRGKGSQVLAAVTRSPGEMVVGDVSGPGHARAGHVIVRPERVGICGSDFHLFSGDVGALSGSRDYYPRIQGHEVSAIVEDPGDSATASGERVAVWPLLPCGRCYPCRIGRPNVCPRSEEHTSELQSRLHLVCRLLLEKKKKNISSLAITQKKNRIIHR